MRPARRLTRVCGASRAEQAAVWWLTSPDLTTFCRLEELGLEAVGQRLDSDRAVLACRVVAPDQWCRRCGCEGAGADRRGRRRHRRPRHRDRRPVGPLADAVARLDAIPGIRPTVAAVIIAEVGLDMKRFLTPPTCARGRGSAPRVKSSAGKTKGNGATATGTATSPAPRGEACGRRRDPHLPRRPLPTARPPPRQEEGRRRRRQIDPGHRLAPACLPRHALPRSLRLLRPTRQHRRQAAQPHPPTRSPRLQGHPRTRSLTPPRVAQSLPGHPHFRTSCRLAHLSDAEWPPSRTGIAPPRSARLAPVRKARRRRRPTVVMVRS